MVEHLDDLEIGAARERQDHVAGTEAWVHASVGEVPAEQSPDALGGAGEAIRSCCVRKMVQAHVCILDNGARAADAGVSFS